MLFLRLFVYSESHVFAYEFYDSLVIFSKNASWDFVRESIGYVDEF